ncbi:hypothetical protein [Halobacillus ihumii]|uniref:hypothetical protein n=1 Tax=Halobacillus ihumii TaxID=2686092 RepID=UPI0013D5FFDE|nr:hypothetical protein [Halobacillus ihumii]
MKIKMRVSMASEYSVKNIGDVLDVSDEIGAAWVAAGIAEKTDLEPNVPYEPQPNNGENPDDNDDKTNILEGTVEEVVQSLEGLSKTELEDLLEQEKSDKDRKGVKEEIEQQLKENEESPNNEEGKE